MGSHDRSDRDFLEAFLRLVGAAPEEVPGEMLDAWTERVPVVRHGRPPWESEVPVDRLASEPIPALVLSGDHHPAFDAVCEELTRRLGARSTVIRGAGHEVQMMAEPCNRALLDLWSSPASAASRPGARPAVQPGMRPGVAGTGL